MKKVLVLCCVSFLGNACAAEEKVANLGDGFYAGVGGSFTHTTSQADVLWIAGVSVVPGKVVQSRKHDQAGVSLVFGYGRCIMERGYIGGELSLDISGDKSYSGTYTYSKGSYVVEYHGKNRGFVPSAAVRLGYYLAPSVMFYVKAGGAYVKSDFYDGIGEALQPCSFFGSDVTVSKPVPVVGIGVERKVCGNFGLRIEGDYRFSSKRTSSEVVSDDDAVVVFGVRNRVRGCTVRLVGTYALGL